MVFILRDCASVVALAWKTKSLSLCLLNYFPQLQKNPSRLSHSPFSSIFTCIISSQSVVHMISSTAFGVLLIMFSRWKYRWVSSILLVIWLELELQDPYKGFLRVTRVWDILQLKRRTGYFFEISSFLSARPKPSLLVFCPACPEPGVNIPLDAKQIPYDLRSVLCHITLP